MVSKIQILVPVYNDSRILRFLSSLEATNFIGELIIWEGSERASYLNELVSSKFQVVVHHGQDKGIFDAFNKLLDFSTAEIVCMMGCDDMFEIDFDFDRVEKSFVNNNFVVLPNVVYFSGQESNVVRRINYSHYSPYSYFVGKPFYHVGSFIRRESIGSLRFDISMHINADYKFFLQFFRRNLHTDVFILGQAVLLETGGYSSSLRSRISGHSSLIKAFGIFNLIWPFHFPIRVIYKILSYLK